MEFINNSKIKFTSNNIDNIFLNDFKRYKIEKNYTKILLTVIKAIIPNKFWFLTKLNNIEGSAQ